MMAAQQYVRHREAANDWRARVVGVLDQPVAVRFLSYRRGVDDARDETRDGIDDYHRRQLTASEDVIADRDFLGANDGNRSIVDPLVAAADESNTLRRGKIFGHRLREEAATRGHREDPGAFPLASDGLLDGGDDG